MLADCGLTDFAQSAPKAGSQRLEASLGASPAHANVTFGGRIQLFPNLSYSGVRSLSRVNLQKRPISQK